MYNILRYISNSYGFIAVLYMVLFSACTDDESILSDNTKHLEINVNTHGPCLSRSVIHDEWLPDGSSIGVSLFDAEDENDYEGKGYNNIKYSSKGSEGNQTWVAEKTVSLSDNAANLVAYYPYNGLPDLDLEAIPVNIESQNDYMFSGVVCGLSNANYKADITMQHALSAIRVKLILGDYSSPQNVSQITVSSAGLASSARLNVFNGTLTNISGHYTSISIVKDCIITTTGIDTDFLFVPDGSVTEGDTDISILVDGKEYCTGIKFDEAYKQGYIYTYILKWDHTDFILDKVKVTPWQGGKEASDELQVYIPDDEYIVEIQVPSDNYEFRHNIEGIKGSIDWGDGIIEDFGSGSYCLHNYEKAGTYTVIVKGKLSALSPSWSSLRASKVISKLVKIGVDLGIKEAAEAFSGQTLLSEIVPGALDGCFQVTDFGGMFAGCTSLQAIPEGLFDKCTKAVNFGYNFYTMAGIFQSCSSLTEIPEGLFDKCTKVTNFKRVFAGCTKIKKIPNGLFDYNIKVTDFSFAFQQCWNLESIPVGLFDNCPEVITFEHTFGGASGVSGGDPLNGGIGFTVIPEGLFDKCTKVTTFDGTFSGCSGIQSIPEGLFDNCPHVNSFNGTFQECTNLTSVPNDLFKYNRIAWDFGYTFKGCKSLQTIPARLLADKNQSSTRCDFYATFSGCENLQEIPEGLFENTLTDGYGFSYTFSGCKSLQKIGDKAFKGCSTTTTMVDPFTGCDNIKEIGNNVFEGCTSMTKFQGMFENHPNLTKLGGYIFKDCKIYTSFSGCKSLTEISENLFAGLDIENRTSFWGVFQNCSSLKSIPKGLFKGFVNVTTFADAFMGCKSLESIPEGLFDDCPNATNFGWSFSGCSSLQSIPEGLFDKCTKASYFYQTFYNCTNLTGESPYTVINIDGEDVKVHLYERANYPDYFTAPSNTGICFSNCNNLTDYNSIPSDWK